MLILSSTRVGQLVKPAVQHSVSHVVNISGYNPELESTWCQACPSTYMHMGSDAMLQQTFRTSEPAGASSAGELLSAGTSSPVS
jgi:hypothetical protein